jgi:hypothetical protein
VTSQRGPARSRNTVLAAILVTVAVLAVAPTGLSSSGGIGTGDPGFDAENGGCTACHGGGQFAATPADITITFTDAGGNELTGLYQHGAAYTVSIVLDEQTGVGETNAAGLNLFADAGTFEAGEGTRLTESGEITHADASSTTWTATWTAPDEGAVVFRLYVNDVDGSLAPDAADQVYYRLFSLTDDTANLPGAVEESEPHVGVPLPQYWLGLLALATMMAVILFAYVYLKYSNPHNANHKDR